jgi:small subunit ribosomal protein S21
VAFTPAREGEDIERMLRRFKRQVKDEDIIQSVRDREAYEKPSEVKKKTQRERERLNDRRMKMEEF